VYEAAGIRIGRCSVMHVDKNYVRKGKVDVRGLLTTEEVTAGIKALAAGVPDRIRRQLEVRALPAAPEAEIEKTKCDGCVLHDECWSFLPERHVFCLYYAGRKPLDLMDRGILAIRDIPEDFPLSAKQQIQFDCEKTGEPHIERRGIQAFLGQLEYPLCFLDFETFMTAIPMYDELSPYEQVPFQYSLHVATSPGRRADHYSYLSDGKADPRPEILAELKKQLGGSGSIVAYNAAFEINVLKSCTGRFPLFQSWYKTIQPRFVDLMKPFRDFHYYHPDQLGSASLKAVLPALTGLSYEGLEISEGGEASLRFREMAFGNATEARKKKIRTELEAYCAQDTAGMIQILDALQKFR
jgi:hypothetical protein